MFFLLAGLSQTKPKIRKTRQADLLLHWDGAARGAGPVAAQLSLHLLMGLWEQPNLTPDCSKNAERGLQPGDESRSLKVDPQ